MSPVPVVHRFGSTAGPREAVDVHVERVLDGPLLTAMDDTDWTAAPSDGSPAGSLAEMLVPELPPDSPIPECLRRLLLSGTGWRQLARLARPGAPAMRGAFLTVNDLAVLLRHQPSAGPGVDPLGRDGMTSWAGEALAVHRRGLFVTGGEETHR